MINWKSFAGSHVNLALTSSQLARQVGPRRVKLVGAPVNSLECRMSNCIRFYLSLDLLFISRPVAKDDRPFGCMAGMPVPPGWLALIGYSRSTVHRSCLTGSYIIAGCVWQSYMTMEWEWSMDRLPFHAAPAGSLKWKSKIEPDWGHQNPFHTRGVPRKWSNIYISFGIARWASCLGSLFQFPSYDRCGIELASFDFMVVSTVVLSHTFRELWRASINNVNIKFFYTVWSEWPPGFNNLNLRGEKTVGIDWMTTRVNAVCGGLSGPTISIPWKNCMPRISWPKFSKKNCFTRLALWSWASWSIVTILKRFWIRGASDVHETSRNSLIGSMRLICVLLRFVSHLMFTKLLNWVHEVDMCAPSIREPSDVHETS